MTQRIPLRMINESNQAIIIDIVDRKYEVKTTSLAISPDSLPPLGKLITYIGEDEVIVLGSGTMTIRQENE